MKPALIITGAAAAVFSLFLFSGRVLSPYSTFSEAQLSERRVQITGAPVVKKNAVPVRDTHGCILIKLSDVHNTNDNLTIRYCKAVPRNIIHADQIAAHGSYNRERGVFEADRLYYKCPSKYESRTRQTE